MNGHHNGDSKFITMDSLLGRQIHVRENLPAAAVSLAGNSSMHQPFAAGIRPKLDAVDKARHQTRGLNIQLPAIAVVGDQSSGKSSVLESLSGVALPRGGNLVTRCPLELALRRGPTESAILSYTDPGDSSSQLSRSLQLDDIPEAVKAATEHLAGTNSGLVPALISLKVITPDAPDLTLIDLPGIVRNPISDQPDDIEQQIKDLINKHIEGESKVILCVLPATADFATQEAIKISRQHDPSGKRTVGVVTKIDLAEPGIRDRLEATGADHLRLDLGYVAVRNRTLAELQQDVSSEQARDIEETFFRQHAELKDIGEEYKGMAALSRKLVQIQDQCIQSHLPALQKEVNSNLKAAEEAMRKMQGVISTDAEAEKCLSGLLEKMHMRLMGLVNAAYVAGDNTVTELHVAPRVNDMFLKYTDELWEAVGGRDVFKTKACHDMLKQHTSEVRGATLPNFVGDRVFNGIFAEAICSNLGPSARDLVDDVHHYMEEVLWKLIGDVTLPFPRLTSAIKALVQEELVSLAQQANTNVKYLLEAEKHVFTNSGGYMTKVNDMKRYLQKKREPQAFVPPRHRGMPVLQERSWAEDSVKDSEDEELSKLDVLQAEGDNVEDLVDLQLSLVAYTQVVIKNLCDSVPKLVYTQLVSTVAESLTSIIREGLSTEQGSKLIDFMHDPQRVATYKQLQETAVNLKKVHATLRKL